MWTDGLAIVLGVSIAALLGWWVGFRFHPKPSFWNRYWYVMSATIIVLTITLIGLPVLGIIFDF